VTAASSTRAAGGTDRVELGPSSILWRYAGDSRIAFLGGTIGLLQLMHPAIGAGVLQHSNFFEDPAGRVFRSLPRILGAVYDADAEATGAEVRHAHDGIAGDLPGGGRYHALDPATFWWAHATFQFMAEQVADRFDRRRLADAEREQLYAEGVEWYRRYGVSTRAVPPTRAEFEAEWHRICVDVLETNDAVAFVLDTLRAPLLPPWDERAGIPRRLLPLANLPVTRWALARGARLVALGGLPPIVRERFGIRWTRWDDVALRAVEWWIRWTWPLLPASFRWQPRALDGWRRTRRRAAPRSLSRVSAGRGGGRGSGGC
jgi:uncharacterized protein (DUF2236 family)